MSTASMDGRLGQYHTERRLFSARGFDDQATHQFDASFYKIPKGNGGFGAPVVFV